MTQSDPHALQIICGGVWHNAVLCMACWLLALLLPILLGPVYTTGRGAVVRSNLTSSLPVSTDGLHTGVQVQIQDSGHYCGRLVWIHL